MENRCALLGGVMVVSTSLFQGCPVEGLMDLDQDVVGVLGGDTLIELFVEPLGKGGLVFTAKWADGWGGV